MTTLEKISIYQISNGIGIYKFKTLINLNAHRLKNAYKAPNHSTMSYSNFKRNFHGDKSINGK